MHYVLLFIVTLTFFSSAATSTFDVPTYPKLVLDNSVDHEVVDDTWKSVTLTLRKSDSSLSTIKLLRPQWWLNNNGISVGGNYHLNVPEIGIVGESFVQSVDTISIDSISRDSAGRFVIGTYIHHNVAILDLYFDGDMDEPIGTSEVHPFWSVTRNEWIEAAHLKVGEYVKTFKGILRLTFRVKRETPETVYNLEVQKEHTFYVTDDALLVHNTGPCIPKGPEAEGLISKWDKASFPTIEKSLQYHYREHGRGGMMRYLRKAANFNYKGAKKKILSDGAVRYNRKSGEFIITRGGKIVSYGE